MKSSKIDKNKDLTKESDSIFYEYKIEIIDQMKYDFLIDKNGEFKIKDSLGEILFSQTKNVTDFVIMDFNGDGFKDVIISHPSNRILETLLLYDSELQKFVLIDNFIDYPDSKKIKSSNFYYSYQGAGCAQNDWISRLYLIDNNKIIDKGLIKGFGCLKNEKNGVYIYHLGKKGNTLIKFIKDDNGFGQKKFDFIDNYWIKNLKKFK